MINEIILNVFLMGFYIVCCFCQEWLDKCLVWDFQDFGGIDMIQILLLMLWKLDIVLYNKQVIYVY